MEPLRIGILGPISWRVPPRHYGGWELVAHHLTEGLVRPRAQGDAVRQRRLA